MWIVRGFATGGDGTESGVICRERRGFGTGHGDSSTSSVAGGSVDDSDTRGSSELSLDSKMC